MHTSASTTTEEGKKMAKRIDKAEIRQTLRDAYECLTGYHAYAESMRAIGRGYHPTGTVGQSVESVMQAIRIDAKKLEG